MQSSFFPTGGFICKLTQLGIISVSGPDAVSYLQGKVTIDIGALADDQVQIGCQCDFKGKTWSIFYAFKDQQCVSLISHTDSIPASLLELKKFGVFSDATFEDQTESWTFFAGAGDKAETIATQIFGALPAQHNTRITNEKGSVIRLNTPVSRYLLMLKKESADELQADLNGQLDTEQYWEALDIRAGIANIQAETSNEFVPQMMNLQALDAINFEKGCYLGQEVVARTKYLGKNKRAAFILAADSEHKCKAGQQLEIKLGENWRRGGTVLRSAAIESQTWILAVLPNDTELGQVFRMKDQPTLELIVQALPYSLT